MALLIDTSKNLHHAYLLEGKREIIFQELLDFLGTKLNFSVISNPDFWVGDFDTLGIDDSRAIKSFQSNKSFAEDHKKILVIKTNFITHEAQNSLLKVFEEPTENTHLFLIMPSGEGLLSTLKSRLMVLKELGVALSSDSPKLGVEEFLKADVTKRFELIKVFLPKEKEPLNLRSGKDKISKTEVINFLNELEMELYKNFQTKRATASPSPSNSDIENIFSEIRQCRSYLNDRSPSVKMILEHLSQIISVKI